MLPDHSTLVRITYVRLGLKDWQQIEDTARALFLDHLVSAQPSTASTLDGLSTRVIDILRFSAANDDRER